MGHPRIQPQIYAHLKSHPNEQFTARQVAEALGLKSPYITDALNRVAKNHPATVKRIGVGSTGRLAVYAYRKKVNGEATASAEATSTAVAAVSPQLDDILVTIPIGSNQTATLTLAQAQKVYAQLHLLFAGIAVK